MAKYVQHETCQTQIYIFTENKNKSEEAMSTIVDKMENKRII